MSLIYELGLFTSRLRVTNSVFLILEGDGPGIELFASTTDSGISSGKDIFEYISGPALKIKKTLEISFYKLKVSFAK